jgi:hypothetical protein
MYQPKVNDAVSGTLTGVPFTGTVTQVFVGFCEVRFNTPLGSNRLTSTLISTSKLTLVERMADPNAVHAEIFPAPVDAAEHPVAADQPPLSVLDSPDTAE